MKMKVRMKAMRFFVKSRIWADSRGFGMNELLGIAAALIIAGFIIIPGFKELADSMMELLGDWWDDVASNIIDMT